VFIFIFPDQGQTMADEKPVKGDQDQDRGEQPSESDEARAFATKFNISLDKAKRLLEQHRAILERETGKPRRSDGRS
jgi:hypothetical protein